MSEANSMDCRVGPRAWVIFANNGNCRMWTTFQPHIQKAADAEGLTVTLLFDQTTIDAAVAAERERCAKACEAVYEGTLDGGQDPWHVASRECAEAIRRASGGRSERN